MGIMKSVLSYRFWCHAIYNSVHGVDAVVSHCKLCLEICFPKIE